MSINNKRSYTEYTVTRPTTDFAIGFDDFAEGGKDSILVTLNGVLVESLGYATTRKNASTVRITPAITVGTVRLTRETDIDEPFHKFTAGALFSAKSIDENFAQIRHSQQETSDGFTFLEFNANSVFQEASRATVAANTAVSTANTAATVATSMNTTLESKLTNIKQYATDVVNDAINNTAVEGGVLADTFVTATKKTSTAVARSMRDVNGDVVSVLDFYDPIATPNNHTAAFNNAITYVSSLGGGTVDVPDGLFYINPATGINMKSNVEIRGSMNSRIECLAHNLTNYGIFNIKGVENIRISSLKLNGRRDLNSATGGEWGMGFDIRSAKNVSIKDLYIENCWGDGIYISRTGSVYLPNGLPYTEGLKLENITIAGCRRQGISVISLKDSQWDNIKVTNTGGTEPAAGVDFEPDYLDELLENITINNLVTENNEGMGLTFYLVQLFGTNPNADAALYDTFTGFARPPEQVARWVSAGRLAAKKPNTVSVTINKWRNLNGRGFSLAGSGSEFLRGYVTINDSYIRYSAADTSKGCVFADYLFRDAPTLNVNNTTLVNATAGARNQVTLGDPVKLNKPMGGIHLYKVHNIDELPTVDDEFAFRIADSLKKTQDFADISIIDCKSTPKKAVAAYIGGTITDVRARNVTIIDTDNNFTKTITSANFNLYPNFDATTFYRADNELPIITIDINGQPIGGGVITTYSNELCAVGSGKELHIRISSAAPLNNMPRNTNNKRAGQYQTIVIPAGSYVKIKTITGTLGSVVYMDNATARATWNFGESIKPFSKTIAVGESAFLNHHLHNMTESMGFQITTVPADLKGLTLQNARLDGTDSHVVRPTFVNNTTAPITWVGDVKVNVIY